MLSGGGTGGHIFPAVSIAKEFVRRYPDAEVLFVGAKNRMEMEKVPKEGFKIEGLWISGLQRKLTIDNLAFPLKLISSVLKSWFLIRSFKPDVVVGTGGFASGPLLFVASKKGIPTLIQEQNSYPGITNKLLSKTVDKICVAFTGLHRYFPKEKLVLTGNPIRKNLKDNSLSKKDAIDQFSLDANLKTVLVLGGSLGAGAINKAISENLDWFIKNDVQLIWQCGKLYYNKYVGAVESKKNKNIQIHAFLENMDAAYKAADFIISRAGAGTISELAVVGKPVIFIPSPNVAEDHQTKNALSLVDKDAAILVREKQINSSLISELENIFNNGDKVQKMKENLKLLAKPNASCDIVNQVEKILRR